MLRPILLIAVLTGLAACSHDPARDAAPTQTPGQGEIHPSNDFPGNGRDVQAPRRENLYVERLTQNLPIPGPEFLEGLRWQDSYLAKPSVPQTYAFDTLNLQKDQLRQTVRTLQHWLEAPQARPAPRLKAYELKGQDSRGNVQFTGYYAPIMQVRRQPDAQFRYPLYQRPNVAKGTPLPSREQIDFEGALAGQGLELAWTASLVDNFFLQVQGSGVVEYEDGRRELLSWGGVNGHAYRSIGKRLIELGEIAPDQISAQAIVAWLKQHPQRTRELLSYNPSYLFFTRGPERPVGAANVPLIPHHSIAVDPSVIPLGAVVLAQLPILDEAGQLVRHEHRLLIAQDKGGAIKGPGHVDVYKGIGPVAQHQAGQLKHYGKLWLLVAE